MFIETMGALFGAPWCHGHEVKFYDAFVDKESDWMIIVPRFEIMSDSASASSA